jgi:molybdopterin-guanine dinucleotide biosynthesis protein A
MLINKCRFSFPSFFFIICIYICNMPGQDNITAIILAGGKSSRMKEEKGLVYFNGKMLVEHVIASLKKITSHIIFVTQNEAYKKFGYPCYADVLTGKGALGGIYTGLVHSTTQKNLVVGCDMPFLSEVLLNALVNKSSDEDVLLIEHAGKAEPLCSLYDRNCIAHIRSLLEQDQLKITTALEGLKTRVVSFDGEEWFRGDEFANINSDEELKRFENNNKNKFN